MRHDAYVGNIYFCQIVRQQASQTCWCCEIPGWSTTMLRFNNRLDLHETSIKMSTSKVVFRPEPVVLIQLSKLGLMMAWQAHCLPEDAKILCWRVHEPSIKEHQPSSKHHFVIATLFPVQTRRCSSIVTLLRIPFFWMDRDPAKSIWGFRVVVHCGARFWRSLRASVLGGFAQNPFRGRWPGCKDLIWIFFSYKNWWNEKHNLHQSFRNQIWLVTLC